jgi:Uma2 family endonuclease
MASPVETGLTVDDLARFDDDERHKYELIDGELFVSPKGVLRHQHVATRLARRLLDWADAHGAAAFVEPDVSYTDRDYVIPDVVLLAAETIARVDEQRPIETTPDLIVEVSSPSTRRLDLIRKRALYEREGVPEYWFVDLDADRVEIYRLGGGQRASASAGTPPTRPAEGRYGQPELVGAGGVLRAAHLEGLAVEVDDILRPLR